MFCRAGLMVLVAWTTISVPSGIGAEPVGVVSHVKVLSDKTEDVSSIEAWKRSFMKPGMSDREKALAVWKTVVAFRHQDSPPNEFLQGENNVHDPIKTFNVRIDADYRQPFGGFRPVKVTYLWTENGRVRRDVHVALKPRETYTIRCEAPPVMRSIVLELAGE